MSLSNDEVKRYSRHLIMPEVGVDGQRSSRPAACSASARAGLARRSRCISPPRASAASASSISTSSISSNLQRQVIHGTADVGRIEARVGQGSAAGAQSAHHRSTRYETALSSENALRSVPAVRRRHRRHGQFPDALPHQRRVRASQEAERLRQHLPLRRTGLRVRDHSDGPCYRCLYPGTAAAGPRAELRRRWRARRAAGRHRHDSGHRSDEADRRHRRAAHRPVPDLRRAPDEVPRAQAPARLPTARCAAPIRR